MRLHIELADSLVGEIDRIAGPRGRSKFIRDAIQNGLRHERQRELLARSRGVLKGSTHGWDGDPALWVHEQRRSDKDRVG